MFYVKQSFNNCSIIKKMYIWEIDWFKIDLFENEISLKSKNLIYNNFFALLSYFLLYANFEISST